LFFEATRAAITANILIKVWMLAMSFSYSSSDSLGTLKMILGIHKPDAINPT